MTPTSFQRWSQPRAKVSTHYQDNLGSNNALVYNMGIDLATVIAAMAVIEVGTPMSYDPGFSIGGSSDKSNMLDNLGGLLGEST